MAYRAKTREQAKAYFAGWENAEIDYEHQDRSFRKKYPIGEYEAYRAGYHEYRIYGIKRNSR